MFSKVEKKSKNFLWGTKPPTFNKQILHNPIEQGGLKYQNLSDLDKSLKITWIRSILSIEDGWSIFPHFFNLRKVFLFVDIYFNMILKNAAIYSGRT